MTRQLAHDNTKGEEIRTETSPPVAPPANNGHALLTQTVSVFSTNSNNISNVNISSVGNNNDVTFFDSRGVRHTVTRSHNPHAHDASGTTESSESGSSDWTDAEDGLDSPAPTSRSSTTSSRRTGGFRSIWRQRATKSQARASVVSTQGHPSAPEVAPESPECPGYVLHNVASENGSYTAAYACEHSNPHCETIRVQFGLGSTDSATALDQQQEPNAATQDGSDRNARDESDAHPISANGTNDMPPAYSAYPTSGNAGTSGYIRIGSSTNHINANVGNISNVNVYNSFNGRNPSGDKAVGQQHMPDTWNAHNNNPGPSNMSAWIQQITRQNMNATAMGYHIYAGGPYTNIQLANNGQDHSSHYTINPDGTRTYYSVVGDNVTYYHTS